jgi:hypothetical protein
LVSGFDGSDPAIKSGYQYTYAPIPAAGLNSSFTLSVVPLKVGATGQRGFYSDQTNVIRFTPDGTPPTPASMPIQ